MKYGPSLVLVASLALLAACQPIEEEEESSLDPQLRGCLPIEGEVSVVDPNPATCVGCEILNEENAVDGNPASFATIRMPAGEGGSATIRVTNPTDFLAGRYFGILHSIEYGKSINATITVGTRKAGLATADQETLNLGSIVSGDENSPTRVAYESSADFDEVQVSFSRDDTASSSGVVTARIHEFCSNAPPVD